MIKISHLKKTYKNGKIETNALCDVSMEINRGEFVMILGRSGCGKSTLLNVLGGIDLPTGGSYIFEDREVSSLNNKQLAYFRNKKIGYIFQAYHLVDELNATNNVALPLGYAGVRKKEREKRAREALLRVGLADREKHYPNQLSGGQQQRVAIARAIVNNPSVILADEPTGNLDEENGKVIMELLKKLNDEGTTIVMVTHDKSLTSYADRVIEIKDGCCDSKPD